MNENQKDTPGEGLDPKALDLVCVEWPHMPRDVLSEIVDDYLAASRSPSVASDTAALPSGYEGLVELLTKLDTPLLSLGKWSDVRKEVREAIAALGRVEPVGEAGTMPGTEGFTMACFEASKVPVGTKLYATPPAPQPALALIEELTGALEQIADTSEYYDGMGLLQFRPILSAEQAQSIAFRALAKAKRFKGE